MDIPAMEHPDALRVRSVSLAADGPGLAGWRKFLSQAANGCLFHDPDFLAYHPDGRFDFQHLIIEYDGAIVALLPGGVTRRESYSTFRSPLGASFGGPVLAEAARASAAIEMLQAVQSHARSMGWQEVELVPPPAIYREDGSDVADFSLWAAGFRLKSRMLCHAIRLRPGESEQFARSFRGKNVRRARNALKKGVETAIGGRELIEPFTAVFHQTYSRHGVAPTHSIAELRDLLTRMPERFQLAVAQWNGTPLGGLFIMKMSRRVANAFYICQAGDQPEMNAGLAMFATTLDRLAADGYAMLDLGPSSDADGRLNTGVSYFKESLGAIGYCRDAWTWTAQP